jgi:primosomal replication protein N
MAIFEFGVLVPLADGAPSHQPQAAWVDALVLMLGSAWIGSNSPWQVPFAAAVLCVPFYMVSVQIERRFAQTRWSAEQALLWSRQANRLTYGVMFGSLLAVAGWLAARSLRDGV